ncbi:hypothetical protein TNCV_2207391 [Trichonephila clavipes]|uniref:Uncharacterized protein n=1 Tax=Trichonephila clavipes TaxID=2585209 RepID=A0A8X6S5R7_TRICX|nr:hypothetical protein TNCV_2207391 [Trichonephila clavipes]
MMVWGAIAYMPRSPLVCIDGTLISDVLRPVALCFIRVLQNPTFQQDNARYGKCLDVALACTFIRSLANSKRLVHGCQVTGPSYAIHYG